MTLLDTSVLGLSQAQAQERLQTLGPNEVKEKQQSAVLEFLSRYWGPMPWLLELTMALSFFLGHILEGIIIFALLSINAVIGFWNERSFHKALELLKNRLSTKTRVLRDAQWTSVEAREIVPGDVITVALGDIVSADVQIISDSTLSVDQSALTGESLPVALQRSSLAYSGSIIKRGEAQGVVLNTGPHTYFGKTVELVGTARALSHQQQIMMAVVKYMMYVSVTAMGMVLLVFANDFVTMSLATDRVTSTGNPNVWNIKRITMASLLLGVLLVAEGLVTVAVGRWYFHLDLARLQSLVMLMLVFTSQFKILIVRDRRHFWSSRPGKTLLVSAILTVAAFAVLGVYGSIIPPLTVRPLLFALLFSAGFTLLMDFPKYRVFQRYGL
ncbi:MAG: cation-transporting P-type ATPase [Planctomycetes bacterium]|nr:cation-transporting P-type ATPase [Planctomycetota bacterium]